MLSLSTALTSHLMYSKQYAQTAVSQHLSNYFQPHKKTQSSQPSVTQIVQSYNWARHIIASFQTDWHS